MTSGRLSFGNPTMPTLPVSILDGGKRLPRTQIRMRRETDAPSRVIGDASVASQAYRSSMAIEPKAKRASKRQEDAALLAELLADEIDFMDHPDFHKAGAEKRIFVDAPAVPKPSVTWYRPMMDDIGEPGQRRHEGIVLTAAQERVIFMQFNYARYRMRRIQKALRGKAPGAEEARELLRWHGTASRLRDQIAETNLALVLAMAKRVRLGEGEFADLIGEGNMALMRAVDKFDCNRGFKFSTYACRAILKAFSRHGIKLAKHKQRFPVEFDPALEQGEGVAAIRATSERQDAAELREIVESNRADLSEVERAVVMHRFALEGTEQGRPPTLAQVGRLIGLTKERVRQIQNQAFEKLRLAIEGAPRASTGGDAVAVN
jgi:RNA polymerase primary sigma factor